VRANYLASPPLVVAYALAGRVDIDLQTEPLGSDQNGQGVFLKDIWPPRRSAAVVKRSVRAEMFQKQYSEVFQGDARWNSVKVPTGDLYEWSEKSTYIRKPPYFENMVDPATSVQDFSGLRVLAMLGDSVTTDHISPAGNIPADSPLENS
jgi:aconitate hydratase